MHIGGKEERGRRYYLLDRSCRCHPNELLSVYMGHVGTAAARSAPELLPLFQVEKEKLAEINILTMRISDEAHGLGDSVTSTLIFDWKKLVLYPSIVLRGNELAMLTTIDFRQQEMLENKRCSTTIKEHIDR